MLLFFSMFYIKILCGYTIKQTFRAITDKYLLKCLYIKISASTKQPEYKLDKLRTHIFFVLEFYCILMYNPLYITFIKRRNICFRQELYNEFSPTTLRK